ncbi:TPA: hypothetical protein ACH3X2_000078 [Trebouxia sp. C0005]
MEALTAAVTLASTDCPKVLTSISSIVEYMEEQEWALTKDVTSANVHGVTRSVASYSRETLLGSGDEESAATHGYLVDKTAKGVPKTAGVLLDTLEDPKAYLASLVL